MKESDNKERADIASKVTGDTGPRFMEAFGQAHRSTSSGKTKDLQQVTLAQQDMLH